MPEDRRRRAALGRFAALLLAGLCLSGCFGTWVTRTNSEFKGDFAGAYPFQAVAVDVKSMSTSESEGGQTPMGAAFKILAFLSFPFDLAIDLVLLPIDLLLWPLGFTRSKGSG